MPEIPDDLEASFWRGHVQLGAVSTAVCASVGIIYAAGAPDLPHRMAIFFVGLTAFLSAPVILTRPLMALFTGPRRLLYNYTWSASLLLAVTAAVLLDGGGGSPLAVLFAPSLVYTAMGYGRSGAVVMGSAGVGAYLLTCLAGSPGGWRVVLTAMALAVTAGTCVVTAGRLRTSLAEQERLSQQLRLQADRDGLTGCLNHRAFIERLEEEVSRAQQGNRYLGFVMLDLDDFKRANDTHGHVAADELLTELGLVLRNSVRSGDTVGRLGGDEFAILAPDADRHAVTQLAARVQAEIEAVGVRLAVSVSVGVSVLRDEDCGRDLRSRADNALYEAKRRADPLPLPVTALS